MSCIQDMFGSFKYLNIIASIKAQKRKTHDLSNTAHAISKGVSNDGHRKNIPHEKRCL